MKKITFSRVIKAITHPRVFLSVLLIKFSPLITNDRLYIKWIFKLQTGKKCNLNRPRTFQEKLQWIKLNDRKDIYHKMVDKYEAKKFIAEKVGRDYVVPTLGIWERFEDIDFNSLPSQFIIKNTHDSQSYYICEDKSQLKIDDIRKRLLKRRNHPYFYSREWCYKGLKHRIIAEPLLNDGKGKFLTDYKFYTFNGEPKFFYLTSNRGLEGGLKEDFFDIEGNLMEINQEGYYNNPNTPSLPINLNKMVEFSRILAEETYHLRVDFYEVNGKLYCGELTFFDGDGWCNFTPEKYNRILGDWIKLPID
jgi:hypothetical protein